jgi:ethanolamine utilization protein EutQ (cupin superfamily)
MPALSKDTAPNVEDFGVAIDQGGDLAGYTAEFVTIRQGHSLAPMLKGLPDDSCQCPHWGYLMSGRLTVRYADREEIFEAGDAFYMPPGHVPTAATGSEFVQFSPTEELAVTVAAIKANAAALQAG